MLQSSIIQYVEVIEHENVIYDVQQLLKILEFCICWETYVTLS